MGHNSPETDKKDASINPILHLVGTKYDLNPLFFAQYWICKTYGQMWKWYFVTKARKL